MTTAVFYFKRQWFDEWE